MSALRIGWIGCGTHASEMLLPQLTRHDVVLQALCDLDVARLAAIGGAAGAAGALAIGRAMSSLLYGVSAGDTAAFGTAIALAIVTTLIACLLPARRAAGLDPLQGLRAD